ncbi:hypothetical protein [Thiothrix sp.]|jgi:hypothetical protein|uniref:hypothetical protein n=1 Tax=Thiothrix sp. TaxID=1032 RepID=UPI00257A30CB|nr:hypothetical protein [Thiothrix sp.]
MRNTFIILPLIVLALAACNADTTPNTSGSIPTSNAANSETVQQIIVKPKSNVVDSNGQLQTAVITALETSASVKLVYIRPMFGEAHVLQFAQALTQQQAAQIFKQWQNQNLIEYAEPDGIAYPSNPATR